MPIVAILILSLGPTGYTRLKARVPEFSEPITFTGPAASKRDAPPSCLMNFLRDECVVMVVYLWRLKLSHGMRRAA
jgi:hypothetical protein